MSRTAGRCARWTRRPLRRRGATFESARTRRPCSRSRSVSACRLTATRTLRNRATGLEVRSRSHRRMFFFCALILCTWLRNETITHNTLRSPFSFICNNLSSSILYLTNSTRTVQVLYSILIARLLSIRPRNAFLIFLFHMSYNNSRYVQHIL